MNTYKRSTFTYMSRDEEDIYIKQRINESNIISSLLDSNLIIQSKLKKCDVKVLECGRYKYLYFFENSRAVSEKGREKVRDKLLINVGTPKKKEISLKEIEERNLKRTRICLTNLVKTNVEDFKTFITLTFDSDKNDIDVNDIMQCNKKFNIWKTYIGQLKKDFKYVCVPEFQKRGAVHYHLLTNIDYSDFTLLSSEERKIWNPGKKSWKIGRDVKGWKYGINMAICLKDINVVGYITKYLQKDVDSRLFGQRKYFHSRNLKQPVEYYLDTENMTYKEFERLLHLKDCKITFEKKYKDYYDNEVHFIEYLENNC